MKNLNFCRLWIVLFLLGACKEVPDYEVRENSPKAPAAENQTAEDSEAGDSDSPREETDKELENDEIDSSEQVEVDKENTEQVEVDKENTEQVEVDKENTGQDSDAGESATQSEPLVCTESEYHKDQDASDLSKGSCVALTECLDSEYESTAPSETSDRVCTPVSICAEDQFVFKQATATADTLCQTKSTCDANQFEVGVSEETGDRICQTHRECQIGAEYEVAAPTETSDRVCVAYTVCSESEFEKSAPTATQDRVCLAKTINIFGNESAFAALKADGTVVTWGDKESGGDSAEVQQNLTNVKSISSSSYNFAALKNDGTAVYWPKINLVRAFTDPERKLEGIQEIVGNDGAFAAILKEENRVIVWGDPLYNPATPGSLEHLDQVVSIFAGSTGFAFLRNDAWASIMYNDRKNAPDSIQRSSEVVPNKKHNVYAVISEDRSLSTQSSHLYGQTHDLLLDPTESLALAHKVKKVIATDDLFVALKFDGTIYAWGEGDKDRISSISGLARGHIEDVVAGKNSFLAKTISGSYFFFDYHHPFPERLQSIHDGLHEFIDITNNDYAHALRRSDGSVVYLESKNRPMESKNPAEVTEFSSQLVQNVQKIVANEQAFAALKSDGTVVTWGSNAYGGSKSTSANGLLTGVKKIFANKASFAAIKNDGSVITWGNPQRGGDSSSAADQLRASE